MSFQCCPLPKKQILWLSAGDEFFPSRDARNLCRSPAIPRLPSKKGSFPQLKRGSNFHSRALRIRGTICVTDCSYVTSGRILRCDFSNPCPGVHAGLQIILGVSASSIEEAGLQLLSGQEEEGLLGGPGTPGIRRHREKLLSPVSPPEILTIHSSPQAPVLELLVTANFHRTIPNKVLLSLLQPVGSHRLHPFRGQVCQ